MDLIDCKEGIKLALNVINYSSAKDKKALVKGLKDHFVEIINTQSSQAFVIIIKLIFSWDDTV
jgi:phenylpyruvate tautomerase PptA (4-oxalocrotonate tautomerase family)